MQTDPNIIKHLLEGSMCTSHTIRCSAQAHSFISWNWQHSGKCGHWVWIL